MSSDDSLLPPLSLEAFHRRKEQMEMTVREMEHQIDKMEDRGDGDDDNVLRVVGQSSVGPTTQAKCAIL